jgi:hypothetical protein
MKIERVFMYNVLKMPRKSCWKLTDIITIEVVRDTPYWLANCEYKGVYLGYGTGRTKRKSIKDLLTLMVDSYELDLRYHEKDPTCVFTETFPIFKELFEEKKCS